MGLELVEGWTEVGVLSDLTEWFGGVDLLASAQAGGGEAKLAEGMECVLALQNFAKGVLGGFILVLEEGPTAAE